MFAAILFEFCGLAELVIYIIVHPCCILHLHSSPWRFGVTPHPPQLHTAHRSAREVNVRGASYIAFLQDLEALVDHGIEEPNERQLLWLLWLKITPILVAMYEHKAYYKEFVTSDFTCSLMYAPYKSLGLGHLVYHYTSWV